jgi:hypothetical protein
MYLVDAKLSAQDVITTRHDKLPPIQKKYRVMCVKVSDMIRRGWLFAGLHMRPNVQHGMLRWCRTALWTLHPMEPGPASRISPKCSKGNGYMSLCLQIHFLLALPVGTILLCVYLKGGPLQMIPPRTCARKTYVNGDLELFCIRELEMYFRLGSMWDIGMLNPGQ